MKYNINMICDIYMISGKCISKTIGNRYGTCNESPAVVAQPIRSYGL